MDIERSAMFDPFWRRKNRICGFDEAVIPVPISRDDEFLCPMFDSSCPAGVEQAARCRSGNSAVMSEDNAMLLLMLPAGKELYEEAHLDWRGGIQTRNKDELEVALIVAWGIWQKARVAESKGALGAEEKAFAALHWLIMGLVWGGGLDVDDLTALEVFGDDDSYFKRLGEEDWWQDQFGPQLGSLRG